MRRIVTFPRGQMEGLLVLSLERGPDGFDAAESAKAIAGEIAQRPGLWGVWPEGLEDWKAPGVADLIEACGSTPIVMTRDLGSTAGWPSAEINWIVDASALVRECPTEHALADRLGQSPWSPPIRDLVVELEADQLPPSPVSLGMLAAATQALAAFVYVPREYLYRRLLIKNLAATSSTAWAVRCR